ncbi:hypothetical protein I79_023733 [Cricetulus griseus]|uniref:Uncharacterized protein n=1 Tax=Cricetulus griseus TaxID=10029 RepID=G3IIQ9_CRIGR|nr:hypothetical protein I79_023733 [Cricetulus griseus]
MVVTTTWLRGFEARSSGKAASAVNWQVTSQDLHSALNKHSDLKSTNNIKS